MSFIGNAPAAIPTSFQAVQADSFNGNGSTTNFTLSRQITNLYDIEVLVDNVQQSPYDGSYSVNGTTITFSSAPGSGTNNIYIVYRDHPITSIQPKGDLTLEANLNVDGTVYANATLARDGGSDATINGVTPTSDNLMGRNRIINGDMRIDQRNAGAAVSVTTATSGYFLDRWIYYNGTGTGNFTVQQSSNAPVGFVNSTLFTVTAPDSSLSSGDYYLISQRIEGTNVSDLAWGTVNAKTVTLSFWVSSSVAGTFGGVVRNNANNRFYPFSYLISNTDTWEYKTVTIAGDTTGTWLTTTALGLEVIFSLGTGQLQPAGSWTASLALSATGETNLMATNGATFYITGVQLEVGSVATSFERRSYGQELQLCQRYFCSSFDVGTAPANNLSYSNNAVIGTLGTYTTANSYATTVYFPASMRANPAITYYSVNLILSPTDNEWLYYNVTGGGWASGNSTTVVTINENYFSTSLAGSWSVNQAILFMGAWSASAEL